MVDSEPLYNGNRSSDGHAHPTGSREGTGSGGYNRGGFMEQDQGNYKQQKIMAGLLRFKWLILLAALTGFAGAWYYNEQVTPEYMASGTIIIHQDSEGSSASGEDLASRVNRSLGPVGSGNIENHVQLLQSRAFAERVADKLLEQEVMSNGKTFPVLLREPEDREPVITSRSQVVSRIRSKTEVSRVSESDDLLEIRYNSHDPLEAKMLTNLFMEEFVAFTAQRAQRSIQATLQFLEDEMLGIVGERLAETEQQIEEFMRNEPGGLDLTSHTNRIMGQLHTLEEGLERNRLELGAIQNHKERLQNELNEIEPGLTDQMKSATTERVRTLQENMANLTIERMLMLNENPSLRNNEDQEPRLQEINREMTQTSEEIDELVSDGLDQTSGFLFTEPGEINTRILELKRQIDDQTVESIRLQALIDHAERRIADLEEQLDQLPEKQMQMAQLQQMRERDESMYNELKSRTFEMGLMKQSKRGSGRIFEDALQPETPFKPNVPVNLIVGLVLGMGLAVSGVFMRVMMDYRIDSIDLLKKTGLPVLSVIPEMRSIIKSQFKGKSHYKVGDKKISTLLVPLYDPISNVSESYRRCFNNIRYNNPDGRNKLFVLTSPAKGEGKTTTISNLAITMGESGNRVILLDCDFRKPHIHRMFGLDLEPGITNYLFDNTPLDELTVSAQAPGLDILTSGKQIVSPDRAINSKKMRRLIEEVSEKYDYILIDTAPFGIISDAAPLIRMSDGVIALVRFNKSKTPEMDCLLENLNSIQAEVVGTVLNDFNPKKASGYYMGNRKYTYNDKVYKSYKNKVKKNNTKRMKKV